MWVTPEVKLPDELIAAQSDGRLVVFVGSGASVGAPSGLPTFRGLARQIALEAFRPFDEKRVDFDVFLGELEEHAVDVHRRAQAILNSPASRPAVIHDAVLGLFSRAADVRIVTTNYDRHLTTVARSRFGGRCRDLSSPSTPARSRFRWPRLPARIR